MDEVKDPHTIIVRPHITEKAAKLSYGDERVLDEAENIRTYTFIVAPDANKIEIKAAVEAIYNAGKKDKDARISVTKVRTVTLHGSLGRRVGARKQGKTPDIKKAVVTLAPGQMLEDYGV
jgi:large subunit ribosomal protein L23